MEKNIKKLEQLIYENDDFKALSKLNQKKSKNIFEIIVKDKDELTFSRTLKYYLDPEENHNQKDYFLKKFFHLLIQKEYYDTDLNRLKIDLFDLNKAQAYREYSIGDGGRIDILIDLPKEVLCMIEVKLLSNEEEGQTDRYFKWAEKDKHDYKYILCCFLTPEGYAAENDYFIPLGFSDIISIFNKEFLIESMNKNNAFLLKNFINWIKELAPMDKKVKEICRNIYCNFKDEIELIVDYAPTITSFVKEITEHINDKYLKEYFAHNGRDWLTLSPRSWMDKKLLLDSKKYTTIRLEYNYSSEVLYLLIVIPNQDHISSYLKQNSHEIFKRDFNQVKSWKNWGKLYYVLYSEENFITENIINSWDDKIKNYSTKIIEYFNKLQEILDVNEAFKLIEKKSN